MASMVRRSAASVAAPLAMRILLGGERSRHLQATSPDIGLLLSTIKKWPLSALHFSTEPEESVLKRPHPNYEYWPLLKVLQCGIDCVVKEQELKDKDDPFSHLLELLENFRLEIKDIACEEVVKFTRQYEGETIDVEVNCLAVGTCLRLCRISGDRKGIANKDTKDENKCPMFLTVRITKDVGPSLEFSVRAQPNIVLIKDLFLKDAKASKDSAYDHRDFGKLDEDLQKAFYNHLYVRGITSSLTNIVHDYMTYKKLREYSRWLENVKKFVEA